MDWLMTRIAGRSRWLWRKVTGRDRRYRPDADLPLTFYGTEYGGAHLNADALSRDSVVYLVGVGTDASFALDLIAAFGLEVYAFDPTPESIEWMKGQSLPPQFHFRPYAIADCDGMARFYPNSNAPANLNYSLDFRAHTQERAIEVPVKRLGTVMRELGHSKIDVLRMDIEGAEYRVIDDLLRSGIEVTQLAVEFHHDKYNDPLETRRAVRQLRRHGYRIMSVQGRDFGFIKR